MSLVKRDMEEYEGKQRAAVDLLIKSGYLETCEHHDEITYTIGGDDEVTDAYKLGNTQWNGGLKDVFKDRREMTDIIKATSEDSDYGEDGCNICRGMMAKD